jgi:CheY-like chemotaxis protein
MRGTVLVVDDQRVNRAVLGRMVRKAGLDVVEAANGAECLDQVRRHPPGRFSCILMDLQVGGVGFLCLSFLYLRPLPVFLCCAHAMNVPT